MVPTQPAASLSPVSATPQRISELADTLHARIRGSIKEIAEINLQARVLSINAQVEAARAGENGRSFAIVGQEMVSFSNRTQQAAQKLEEESEALVLELAEISRQLATSVRGTRLCDLALTNIDLIDRNLYERSCDCRWWATDAAMVAALDQPGEATAKYASQRLGVILKAYTVYFDIVLADRSGTIIANGRPAEFSSVGTKHSDAPWFRSAAATASGDDFGFQSVHESTLVGGKRALVYSCRVCRGGDAKAQALGVLGVVFNWDGLAQKIMHETPIESDRKARTRVCIVDDEGSVLADSQDRILQDNLNFSERSTLFAQKKACLPVTVNGLPHLAAHAQSPGFETYRTGWHSLILEQVKS
jgi:hypothetical protein